MSDLLVREQGAIRIGPFGSALKKDEYSESGIRVLGIDDVLTMGNPRKPKFIPEAKYRELTQYRVHAGDILVTNMGTVGRAFLVPPGFETAIISSHLIKVTPDLASVDAHYLEWALNAAPAVVAQIVRDSRGAIMAGFNTSRLKALAIPLPPIVEQRRIADILDRADALRSRRRDGLARLADLRHSIFLEIFGHPNSNPKHWDVKPLGGEVHSIRYGTGSPPEYVKEGVPFIRATNVKEGTIRPNELKRISEGDAARLSRCNIRFGDLIVVRSGVNTGDCAMVPLEYDGACAAFDLIIELAYPDAVFYNFLINSSYGKRHLSMLTRRAAQPHLNADQLRNLAFIAPPQGPKQDFATRMSQIDALRIDQQASFDHLDALFASIQHRAFRGEL